jgi:hypothetical protein
VDVDIRLHGGAPIPAGAIHLRGEQPVLLEDIEAVIEAAMVEMDGAIHTVPDLGREVRIVGEEGEVQATVVILPGAEVHLPPEGEVEQGVEVQLLGEGETGVRAVVVVSVRVEALFNCLCSYTYSSVVDIISLISNVDMTHKI